MIHGYLISSLYALMASLLWAVRCGALNGAMLSSWVIELMAWVSFSVGVYHLEGVIGGVPGVIGFVGVLLVLRFFSPKQLLLVLSGLLFCTPALLMRQESLHALLACYALMGCVLVAGWTAVRYLSDYSLRHRRFDWALAALDHQLSQISYARRFLWVFFIMAVVSGCVLLPDQAPVLLLLTAVTSIFFARRQNWQEWLMLIGVLMIVLGVLHVYIWW